MMDELNRTYTSSCTTCTYFSWLRSLASIHLTSPPNLWILKNKYQLTFIKYRFKSTTATLVEQAQLMTYNRLFIWDLMEQNK